VATGFDNRRPLSAFEDEGGVASGKYMPSSFLRRAQKEQEDEEKKVKNGFGLSVVSTSRGVMSGLNAYRQGLGGELICEVW
jgi:ribosomal protein S8